MKRVFYIGVIFGGILGVIVALSMDSVLGESLGGGWDDAVAHDLNRLFKTNLPPDHFMVTAGVIAVVGLIGLFGALIGGVFSVMIARFFEILTKEG